MPAEKERKQLNEQKSDPGPNQTGKTADKAKDQRSEIDIVGHRAQHERNIENRQYREAASNYFNTAQIETMVVQHGVTSQIGHSDQTRGRLTSITQVSEGEIDLVLKVYEQPINYLEALDKLNNNHLIILHGRPKIGKRAAAIRLVLDIQREEPQIHEFPPEINLIDQIKPELLDPYHFYLIDGLLAHRAEDLTTSNWNDFSHQLKKRRAFLMICVRQKVRFPADLSPNLRCALKLPTAEPRRIVEKHLGHYLKDYEVAVEQIEAVLEQPKVADLLTPGVSPASAGQLAFRLSLYLKGECGLDETLRGFAAYAEATVEEWFEECDQDPTEQAFRIALAVFDGAQLSAVEEAGKDLAARIMPTEEDKDDKDEDQKKSLPPSPLSRVIKRSPRLERARAHIETVFVETEYNVRSTMKIVRLNDPGYQMALLRLLWEEYDDFRDIFLSWLEHHAINGPSADIRTRAALAIGALAQFDFLIIRTKTFYPWARKNNRLYRAALGNALGMLIWNDHHVEDVLGLLRYWSDSSEEELRWAAGRAYALVGLRYPNEAMERWWLLFQKMSLSVQLTPNLTFSFLDPEAMPMFQSIMDAVTSLFLAAIDWPGRFLVVYQQMLEDLHRWTERDDNPEANPRLGFPLFLMLMSIRVPGSVEENNREAESKPPALLVLADSQEPGSAYFKHLTWLVRRGLDVRETRDITRNLLYEWVDYVNSSQDQELLPALTQVFQSLLSCPESSKRERERIRLYLRRWAMHPRDPLPVAAKLIGDLGLVP